MATSEWARSCATLRVANSPYTPKRILFSVITGLLLFTMPSLKSICGKIILVAVLLAFRRTLRNKEDIHPAVTGWPEKYGKTIMGGTFHPGPQILHDVFTVEKATPERMERLDVNN